MRLKGMPQTSLRLCVHMYSDRDILMLHKAGLIDNIIGTWVVSTRKADRIKVIYDCGLGYQAVMHMIAKIPDGVHDGGDNYLFVVLD